MIKFIALCTLILSSLACSEKLAVPPESPGPAEKSGGETPDKGGSGQGETPSSAPKAVPGALTLVVTYAGPASSKGAALRVDIDKEHCSDKVFGESLIVNVASKGLQNAVLRIKAVRGPKKKIAGLEITNVDCRFQPHVAVAMRGTRLTLKNNDPILHTSHPYIDGAHFFNAPLKKGDTYGPRPINKSGLMKIKCDVHPWMEAWVVVHDSPYVAVSDAEGRLKIDEIPPGKYAYELWHEKLGKKEGEVNIEPSTDTELQVEYPAL